MSLGHIWFWQRIVTPHMTELAIALAHRGCDVTYVAEQPMSADRIEQGWTVPSLPGVHLEFASTANSVLALVAAGQGDSIHICQGLRGNGLVNLAQRGIRARGLRQWVVMETVEDTGLLGAIKRLEYRRLFAVWRGYLRGVLAIGDTMPGWAVARGMLSTKIFPFTYFLKTLNIESFDDVMPKERFRFVFVGQFIDRKRLDLLLEALHRIHVLDFELAVVGSGALESALRAQAEELLPCRIDWLGRLPLNNVPAEIAKADCLVLPSRFDGWGAVVSEALMVGTPVICSDTCGAAGVVRASGKGGVFRSGDRTELIRNLERELSAGPINERDRVSLSNWAGCLGAETGASYVLDILEHDSGSGGKPSPPWRASS